MITKIHTDDDIFDMYANQADRQLLAQMPASRIAADLIEIDPALSPATAAEYSRAIRRVLAQTEKPNRSEVIHVRLTLAERQELERLAGDLKISDYIRRRLFEQ